MQPFSHLGRYLKVIDKFVARRRPIAFIQLFDDFDIALREQIKRKFPHRFCFGRRGSHSRREFQHTCSRLSAHAGSPRETQKSRKNEEFSHTAIVAEPWNAFVVHSRPNTYFLILLTCVSSRSPQWVT